MKIVAGCDIGSLTSKAVIMKDGVIAGSAMVRSMANPQTSAEEVMSKALAAAKLSPGDIGLCIGTGYGRARIPFASESVSEIACHGRAALWMLPSVKTVIDIGGQDCKTMRLDASGRVVKFATNDKCASGTGRFLEVMAKVLGITIDELGPLSSKSSAAVTLASACTVWAQADIIKHLNSGVPVENIAAGINNAMASRVALLVNTVGMEPDICMTGGVAKNSGVVAALSNFIGHKIKLPRRADPQLAGALGAALIAHDRVEGRK